MQNKWNFIRASVWSEILKAPTRMNLPMLLKTLKGRNLDCDALWAARVMFRSITVSPVKRTPIDIGGNSVL